MEPRVRGVLPSPGPALSLSLEPMDTRVVYRTALPALRPLLRASAKSQAAEEERIPATKLSSTPHTVTRLQGHLSRGWGLPWAPEAKMCWLYESLNKRVSSLPHPTLWEWGQGRRVQLLVLPKSPRTSCRPHHTPSSPFPSGQAQSFELQCWPFWPGDPGFEKPSLNLSSLIWKMGTPMAPLSKHSHQVQ